MASFICCVGKVTVSLLKSATRFGIVFFSLCPLRGYRLRLMGIDPKVFYHVLVQLKPQSRAVGYFDESVWIDRYRRR